MPKKKSVSWLRRKQSKRCLKMTSKRLLARAPPTARAAGGGVLGGLIGLIASAGTLLIPGVGPALAAGTLLSVLGATAAGAGIGAAYGGITGALTGWGLAEEHANIYTEGLERGGALLTVHTNDPKRIEAAQQIMVDANGMAVASHEFDRVE